MKRESKAYSYKEQLAEIELRKASWKLYAYYRHVKQNNLLISCSLIHYHGQSAFERIIDIICKGSVGLLLLSSSTEIELVTSYKISDVTGYHGYNFIYSWMLRVCFFHRSWNRRRRRKKINPSWARNSRNSCRYS